MLTLVPIRFPDLRREIDNPAEPLRTVLDMREKLYGRIGYHEPWIGYLARDEGSVIGACGFKGEPVSNIVEIAYFTFPGAEGRGVGTKMCRMLTRIALKHDAEISVRARTLPETNTSTRILEKNGFHLLGTVNDPENGDIWEWEYKAGEEINYERR